MRVCFILAPMTLAALGLQAASMDVYPTRVKTFVRADGRSGRLVRSAVVASRAVTPKVVLPTAPGAEANPQPAAKVNELVASIAKRHDVEALLVDSVIRVESNYNPYAVSPKGAMGLMQLIPGTARRFGVSDTFHPEQNIEGGVRYLKYLMELYGGDERLALAAYNAGEGAVAKYNGIPPYPETRNYVYQVGKRLGQSREAQKKAQASKQEPKPGTRKPVIEWTVDAEGREYYRTR